MQEAAKHIVLLTLNDYDAYLLSGFDFQTTELISATLSNN